MSNDLPARTRRGRPARLTREQIAQVAVAIFRESGVDAVTIRTVAARLGVSPMSLYRYFPSRDAILDDIFRQLFSMLPAPQPPVDDGWEATLRWCAQLLYALYTANPPGISAFNRHPSYVYGASTMITADAVLARLRQAGLGPDDAVAAYGAMLVFVAGHAAMQTGRAAVSRASGLDDEAQVRQWQAILDALPEAEFSAVRFHAPQLARVAEEPQFQAGLTVLVEGVRSLVARAASGKTGSPGPSDQ